MGLAHFFGHRMKYLKPKLDIIKTELKGKTFSTTNVILMSAMEEPSLKISGLNCVRNVGLAAHIDAGKTTTTERMLYYAGLTKIVGEVHDGNTVTDFMDAERERGITITAAAITFPWKISSLSSENKTAAEPSIPCTINLIDTPGHVDFTVEVERALTVLDAAIIILDASAGVQAQTLTVWRQANGESRAKNTGETSIENSSKLPRIIFLNKMDKNNANYKMSIDSIHSKLGSVPIPIQKPIHIGTDNEFRGLVDLVTMEALLWSGKNDPEEQDCWGKYFKRIPISELNLYDYGMSDEELGTLTKSSTQSRIKLIDQLCDIDDNFASLFLETCDCDYNLVSNKDIEKTLRDIVRLRPSEIALVCLGSAYKNIGIQPLMDAIVKYLPSPEDRQKERNVVGNIFGSNNSYFSAMVFKIMHLSHLKHMQSKIGSNNSGLAFIRVFGGRLTAGDTVYSFRSTSSGVIKIKEKVSKLFIAFADDFREVKSIESGHIGVVSGLKESVTGDILVSSDALSYYRAGGAGSDDNTDDSTILPCIHIPDPVIYATIEPGSMSQQKKLEKALLILAREDPSLRVTYDGSNSSLDPESQNSKEKMRSNLGECGQIVLSGMGELHLEVILDRIRREYKVDADLGPFMISYRESVRNTYREIVEFQRSILGKNMKVIFDITVIPNHDIGDQNLEEHTKSLSIHREKPTLKIRLTDGDCPNAVQQLKPWQLKSIHRGFENAITSGPLLGYPLVHTEFILHSAQFRGEGLNAATETVIAVAMEEAVKQLCINSGHGDQSSNIRLLEPIMQLNITSDHDQMSKIVQDLISNRRAQLSNDNHHAESGSVSTKTIFVPLSELRGYSSYLRSFTSGRAFYGMEFSHYSTMSENAELKAIQEVSGF